MLLEGWRHPGRKIELIPSELPSFSPEPQLLSLSTFSPALIVQGFQVVVFRAGRVHISPEIERFPPKAKVSPNHPLRKYRQ